MRINNLVLFSLIFLFCSCDPWLTIVTAPRTLKMKNKKLVEPVGVELVFDPYVWRALDSIKRSDLRFYKGANFDSLPKFYHIEKNLGYYLDKRNVFLSQNSDYRMIIDTLIFNEFTSQDLVESLNDKSNFGYHTKNFFRFRIVGELRDNKTGNSKRFGNTYGRETGTRESYIIKGTTVSTGWAEAQAIINGVLNNISYDIYVVISDFEKKRKEIEKKEIEQNE